MARNNRPPIAEAKAWATGQLVKLHEEEFVTLSDEYLASKGWKQETVVKETWVNNSGVAADKENG